MRLFYLSASAALCNARSTVISIPDGMKQVDLSRVDTSRDCPAISDCYNCILSSCDWDGTVCASSGGERQPLTMADLFEKGKVCPVPDTCQTETEYISGKDMVEYSYKDTGSLQAGEFCLYSIRKNPGSEAYYKMTTDYTN